MELKVVDYQVQPRDSFDGRIVSFQTETWNNSKIVNKAIINMALTGNLFDVNGSDEDAAQFAIRCLKVHIDRAESADTFRSKQIIGYVSDTKNSSEIDLNNFNDIEIIGHTIPLE